MTEFAIVDLDGFEIEKISGGILPLIPAAVSLVALAVGSFAAGYAVGKDIAENENEKAS